MNDEKPFLDCDPSTSLIISKKTMLATERAGFYVRLDEVPSDEQFLKAVCHSLVLRHWTVQWQSMMSLRNLHRKVEDN